MVAIDVVQMSRIILMLVRNISSLTYLACKECYTKHDIMFLIDDGIHVIQGACLFLL